METKFNFNSAICTSKVQSERLLALGLKKETADMYWILNGYIDDYIARPKEKYTITNIPHIPAWSLHRLASLCRTDNIRIAFTEKDCWGGNIKTISLRKAFEKDNLYDNICDCIEWLIEEGYFNKEYLVDQEAIEEHCKGVQEYLDYIREED